MTVASELTGQRFGKLVVVKRVANDKWGLTQWSCKCDCGKTCGVAGHVLNQGRTISCGCFREEESRKHNHRKAPYRDLPRGVYYISQRGAYRASITIDNKTKHLGYYDTPEEAHKEYLRKVNEVD